MRLTTLTLVAALCASAVSAQDSSRGRTATGFRAAGLPNLNYSSDEGVGYGARISLFNHGRGGFNPYAYLVDGNAFLTTRGRKQAFLFFDAPHLLGDGRRLTVELRYQQYDAAPYYGIGNGSRFVEALTEANSERFVQADYYAFERTRTTFWATYQRPIGVFRGIVGAGAVHTRVGPLAGHTLFAAESPLGQAGGWSNYVKLGLVYDTRDFEPAPSRGDWTDVILSRSAAILGSNYSFTRLTVTNRHYFALLPRLVFAERILFEKGWGELPFYEMTFFESSFRPQEGLGGAYTIRGLPQNRFMGPSKLFGNMELRWRVSDFRALRQAFFLGLSTFFDYGRVWAENERFSLRALHTGYGGGVQIGWNETFIVAVDAATSDHADLGIYIGIGYLY